MTAGLFPDVGDVACDLLARFGTVGRYTPPDLSARLPFVRVGVVGGSDDRFTDTSTLDVECFDGVNSDLLAEQIRQFLIGGTVHVVGGVVFDSFRTVARPRPLPWPTPGVFRSIATYRVACRRTTT